VRDPSRARISASAGTVVEIAVDTTTARASRAWGLAYRESLVAAGIAAAVALALVAWGPPAGDESAHLYRTLLVRDGVLVWDNLWYGGHYPLASYSLLYYFPAALVGNLVLVVVAVVVSAALFATIAVEEWGEAARWPSRVFAVCACAPVFTGTYAYAVGFAALLASVWGFQSGRRWLGILCAGLTLGFSPLAFVFLCLALGAIALAYRPARRTIVLVGAWLTLFSALQLAVNILFPAEGRYEFRPKELAWILIAGGLGWVIARGSPRGRALAMLFLLVGAVSLVAFLVPSPIGSNLTRFRTVVLPLALVAVGLVAWRPRWLAVVAVLAAAQYTLSPYVTVAGGLTDTRAAHAAFWQPALSFLRSHRSQNYRVDVVPTFDNWEAYYLPREGFALARGWYRQLDLARNPVLYRDGLTATGYRRWLRSMAVRYVLLPNVPLDRVAAPAQAALLRSGASGLVEVERGPDWTVYELPAPTPLLTGQARAGLTAFEHERIAGFTAAPGSYLLRVRYTPYWSATPGVCLERASNGMTRLVSRRAGAFELRVEGAGGLLRTVFGARPASC